MTHSPDDLRLAELLASRLCHDLVGPISAISNGMELLEEGMSDLDEEARRLVGDSAGQAAGALQFFRIAFGFGASPTDEPGQLRGLLETFLAHRKATIGWPERLPAERLPAGWGKLLLNMAALAAEALPLGGRIEVVATVVDGHGQLRCLSVGPDAGLRPEVAAALDAGATVEAQTPRSVLGFYAARVAARLGAALAAEREAADRFALTAVLPA
ncbi:histidine phosphotransferase family protein [Tistlia consotensis]|nr:histidine phosphotransferase family protein [Tistlia consotensis]